MSRRHLFVTGGAGLLGSALVPLAREAGWVVTEPSSAELDIRDAEAVEAAIAAVTRPVDDEAHPGVRASTGEPAPTDDTGQAIDMTPVGVRASPEGEVNRDVAPTLAIAHLAYRRDERDTIVDGSANVARAATRHGARLVHLSTDALFAGRREPYTEADTPDPVHDYGRWKTEAEREVAGHCPSAVLVRTSLMYLGDGTSPCELDVRRVLEGGSSMRFFTDEIRCFTHVDDVAAAVLRLADPQHPTASGVTGPLHVAAAEPIDRASFARLVAARSGFDPAAVPTSTIADSRLVRPARVVLDVGAATRLGITCRNVSATLGAS